MSQEYKVSHRWGETVYTALVRADTFHFLSVSDGGAIVEFILDNVPVALFVNVIKTEKVSL
jgi:hypothetical protein